MSETMERDDLNLTVCPNCGMQDFPLSSIEQLTGYAVITLTETEGQLAAEFYGQTNMDWNSSQTVGYLCENCYEELPEAYQAALDRLLGITRPT